MVLKLCKFCVCVALFICYQPPFLHAALQSDDQSSDTVNAAVKRDLVSIKACGLQNAKAVASCDVLITVEKFFDSASDDVQSGAVVKSLREIRVLLKENPGFYCYFSEQTDGVLDLESGAERKAFSHAGFSFDGKAGKFVTRRNERFRKGTRQASQPVYDVLRMGSFVDPRGLMLSGETDLDERLFKSVNRTQPDSYDNLKRLKRARRIGKKTIELELENEDSGIPGYTLVVNEKFDVESLMRVSRTINLRNKETGKEFLFENTKFEWKEMDGVQVPTHIRKEKNVTHRVANREETGLDIIDIRMDWLSVNKPIPTERFSEKHLETVESLRRQLLQAKEYLTRLKAASE